MALFFAIKCEGKGTWFILMLPLLIYCIWYIFMHIKARSMSSSNIQKVSYSNPENGEETNKNIDNDEKTNENSDNKNKKDNEKKRKQNKKD